ncbi:MAG: IS4 family transposase [Sulfurimonas sp.]|nr:MAG: IS4 family transposase [Sulfurimonas sp.]
MNCNQKAIKLQKNISINKLKNSTINFLETLVSKNTLSDTIITSIGNYRNRIYTPMQTLSMFISQALNQDSSCQSVVNNMALKRRKSTSISTSAYCKARGRLPKSLLSTLTKDIAINNEKKIDSKWKFRGRNIYLIDGTTITMPDSESNQKEYPHTKTQKEGLGFPVCRIVAIISLTTGSIVDANIGEYSGKGTGEQALLRDMLHNFKKGDIILADAMFSTYTLLSYVLDKGIDIVFVQNGARSRKTDFTLGEILGDNDHIITIKKPKDNPVWMNANEINKIPKEIKIRELKTGGKVLITTMLCPKTTTIKTIKNIYKKRWHIEVDFRNIKITLGLNEFKCKSPKMVRKEMWTHFLAYNLIRSLMLDSALYNKILPRKISFKHCLQLYLNYEYTNANIQYKKLLKLVGEKVIGNRAGRIEPRLIKKRCNSYRLLMTSRSLARVEVIKNGHPKM